MDFFFNFKNIYIINIFKIEKKSLLTLLDCLNHDEKYKLKLTAI